MNQGWQPPAVPPQPLPSGVVWTMVEEQPLLHLQTLAEPPLTAARTDLLHRLRDGGTRSQALAFMLAQQCWAWALTAGEDLDSDAVDDHLSRLMAPLRLDWGHIPQDAHAMRRLQEVCEDHLGRLSGRELCARLILEAKRHQRSLYHHHQQLATQLNAALGSNHSVLAVHLIDHGDGTMGSNADGPLQSLLALGPEKANISFDQRLGIADDLCAKLEWWQRADTGINTGTDALIVCCEGGDHHGCWLPPGCRAQLVSTPPAQCFICCISPALSANPLASYQHPTAHWEWGPWPTGTTVVCELGTRIISNGVLDIGSWTVAQEGRSLL